MRLIFKIIGYSFLLIVSYWLISIIIGKKNGTSNERVHKFHTTKLKISEDTLESRLNGMKLDKKIKVTYVKDPLNQVKNHIYFWAENPILENEYGILSLFHFKKKGTEKLVLHITSPQKWGDSISYICFNPPSVRYLDSSKKSIDGYPMLDELFKDRYTFHDLTDSVGVKFYFIRNEKDTTISFITLKW